MMSSTFMSVFPTAGETHSGFSTWRKWKCSVRSGGKALISASLLFNFFFKYRHYLTDSPVQGHFLSLCTVASGVWRHVTCVMKQALKDP